MSFAQQWGTTDAAADYAFNRANEYSHAVLCEIAKAFDAGANFASALISGDEGDAELNDNNDYETDTDSAIVQMHELMYEEHRSFNFKPSCSCGTWVGKTHMMEADAQKEWEMHLMSAATMHRWANDA